MTGAQILENYYLTLQEWIQIITGLKSEYFEIKIRLITIWKL